MRVVLQRVKEAEVSIEGKTVGKIGRGVLIFLGVSKDDGEKEADYLAKKITELRMFEDHEGKMNVSSFEAIAEMLVISQFTIYGDCRKGRRPSFDQAADPEKGERLYDYFIFALRRHHNKVETGQFRAMMDVKLINDGPVTFILDST